MSTRQVRSAKFIPRAARFWKAFALLLPLVCTSVPAMADEAPSSTEALMKAAALVQKFGEGGDIGDLFRAVRDANPSKGAINTLRELNKALDDKNKEPGKREIPIKSDAKASILGKLTAAQKSIKAIILQARIDAHREFARSDFARDHPQEARSLYGIGDIGSWPGDDNINSDVDSTVFGTDKATAKLFVDEYLNRILLERLAGPGKGLGVKEDFDVVFTPEGSEAEAGVFETRGGKSVASALMVRFIPVNADGTLGTAIRSDIAAERENARVQARLRTLATKMDVYDQFFDVAGRFKRYETKQLSQNPEQIEAWVTFMEAADDEGLLEIDTKLTKAETLAGTCLDMAKHLHHEAIGQLGTLDKKKRKSSAS